MKGEILEDKLLTDEQLDNVTGGTCEENGRDILFPVI